MEIKVLEGLAGIEAQQAKTHIELMQAVDLWGKRSCWLSVAFGFGSMVLGVIAGLAGSRLLPP